jgi:hypothetical protein
MTIYQYSDKYWFDFNTSLIEIQNPYVSVDIQELVNAIRTTEATDIGIGYAQIGAASGKQSLGESVVVGITLELLNNWQLHFWAGSYIAKVSGGNLVGGLAGDPIAYSAGVQVLLIQSAASTRVVTGGTALTTQEHDALMALPSAAVVSDQVWDEVSADHIIPGTTGKKLADAGGGSSPADIAAAVWAYGTRTLSSVGTLVADIWSYVTRVLTATGLTTVEHDQLMALNTSGLLTGVQDSLGISGQNTKWSGMAFDSNNNLISAVITQYTDSTLVTERKKWQLTADYDLQSRLVSYQLKEY